MTFDLELSERERERLSRMAACWQQQRPTDFELFAAKRRRALRAQGLRRSPRLYALVGAVVGLFIGGSVLAAVGALQPRLEGSGDTQQATPPPAEPAETFVRRQGSRRAVERPQEILLEDGESASIERDGTRARYTGPGTLHIDPSRGLLTFVPRTKRLPEPASAPAPASTERTRASSQGPNASQSRRSNRAETARSNAQPFLDQSLNEPETPADGAWTRLAAALDQQDRHKANQALDELRASDDPATRDAALLVSAQLDVNGGDVERARPVLERLLEAGATPLIRERAQRTLELLH